MNSICDRQLQRPGEVGHEHHRALEDADEQQLPAGVVGRDLRGELTDLRRDLVLGQQHGVDVGAVPWSRPSASRVVRGRSVSSRGAPRSFGRVLQRPACQTPVDAPHRPGRATGPCPCQSVTSASTAATWTARQVGGTPAARSQPAITRPRTASGRAASPAPSSRRHRRAAGRSSAASRSRASASARSSARRPGQSGRDARRRLLLSSGSTRCASGPGVYAGSLFCGSSHDGIPARRRRPRVVAAGYPSSGRRQIRAAARTIPASDAGPGPAAQAEQHRLGLVVEGVPERDAGAVLGGRRRERGVPGRPGRGLRAAVAARPGPWTTCTGVQAQVPSAQRCRCGPLRRSLLQAVVDGHRPDGHAGPRRLEGERRGQGEGVGAPAAGDEHAARLEIGEGRPDGAADRGDRRLRAGHRALRRGWPGGRARAPPSRSAPLSSSIRGSVSAAPQTRLKPSMPTASTTPPTKTRPSAYCCIFSSSPSSRRTTRSTGPRPLAALARTACGASHARHDVGPDAVHDVLGVSLDQAHEGGDAGRGPRAGRGHGSAPAGPRDASSPPRTASARLREHVLQAARAAPPGQARWPRRSRRPRPEVAAAATARR